MLQQDATRRFRNLDWYSIGLYALLQQPNSAVPTSSSLSLEQKSQGRHVAPMGVKFGVEEGTGPLLHAKFYPHQCNSKGVGPPKLTFLLNFEQYVEYKRPTGAYPLRDFHKICRVCRTYQAALRVKIWLDMLEGLRSYGGFKLRESGFPQIFSAP